MLESNNGKEPQPHAPMDLDSRIHKAAKIINILGLTGFAQPLRVLEVGTGSGGISHYLANHRDINCAVTSVDTVDIRKISGGYDFEVVGGTDLPFPDTWFDVVISNHVIEHVGDETQQLNHLGELRRVMKDEGVGYLAVPNRWMLIEPHFKLIFLSWLPRSLRSFYLRLSGKGGYYDCEPLSLGNLKRFLAQSRLQGTNRCIDALRETLAIEMSGSLMGRIFSLIPDSVLKLLHPVFPTLIFTFSKS